MKIGFLGNANNYPFTLARSIKRLGHDVVFVIDSPNRLNRPESRYSEITIPYPSWIVDCSPVDLWQYPSNIAQTENIVRILQECDVLVLNEFGIALWGALKKPTFVLLTGTDIEVLADYQYADFCTGGMGQPKSTLKRFWQWARRRSSGKLKTHLLRMIGEQRDAIRHAVGVNYFPPGMLPNTDRLLTELGVNGKRRVFFFVVDTERYGYEAYPNNSTLRVFNVARIAWRKPRDYFICELDYKGTDVLIRGLGMFVRESKMPIEIRLVKKGVDLDLACQLIEQEGFSANVVWLEEMDQSMLYEEYKKADIVFEHFGDGSIGMGACDAMSVGRPVIANGTPEVFRKALGEAPPICHAITAEDVRDQLLRLAANRDLRESVGKQSRSFVKKYWTVDQAAEIIVGKLMHAK